MEEHKIILNGKRYHLSYDKYTGDWSVHSEDDPQVQQDWIRTKKGAINYIFNVSKVRENNEYEMAPDRC